jgi:hypothetical protein
MNENNRTEDMSRDVVSYMDELKVERAVRNILLPGCFGNSGFREVLRIVPSYLTLLLVTSIATAQSSAPTVTRSFDFRNGEQAWQAGFADYPPGTDKNNFYELRGEIRTLPSEIGPGTGFLVQGANHSDDLFMFLKRRLDSNDGIVAGQTYQLNFTIVFGSNAQTGCGGVGGTPGESVWLKAGGSPAEPLASLQPPPSAPGGFSNLRMNVDKSNQSQSGIAASVAGNVANGEPCTLGQRRVVGQFEEVARASRPWNHAQDARATSN